MKYLVAALSEVLLMVPAPAPTVEPVALKPDLVVIDAKGQQIDALSEVNAKRAARGLRPFVRDEALTYAAQACANYRAAHRIFGHTDNDFRFLPKGVSATSAGCAAYPLSYGWMSCCVYDNYVYGGAAWAWGSDGKRYMHLFVR